MKRWVFVVLWFVVQFAWNLLTSNPAHPDDNFVRWCLQAVSHMTSPAQMLVSIAAMIVIWKQPWKRKPLAER